MDLIDEEYVAGFEIGEYGAEVTDFLDRGSGRDADIDTHFFGDDMGECGLSESGGTIEEDVLYILAAMFGGLDEDMEIAFDFFLSDIVGECLRTQCAVKDLFFGKRLGGSELKMESEVE